MGTKIKGFLVDPWKKEIKNCEIDSTRVLKDLYSLIGCNYVDVVRFHPKNDVWFDDEGLFVEAQKFFAVDGYWQPLAGRGVVLSFTDDGDVADCTLGIKEIQEKIRFTN